MCEERLEEFQLHDDHFDLLDSIRAFAQAALDAKFTDAAAALDQDGDGGALLSCGFCVCVAMCVWFLCLCGCVSVWLSVSCPLFLSLSVRLSFTVPL